ncbi:EscU/YscU/HrcU family type III secretion system export apparatus switch protein [Singulisphaera acidiphila]|uniref:Flagellar biosynthesis pathway, component FlhB n=2 Tax=Singulisphaera acidiphila TaxID=466153 RepID=L0DR54_SINAD|nr:EscU/YscU/HrcU family type III secretion system export apparatus switch protein [Singulisphaera acidiphila]AGA31452.1 flagellar biosynthesis pathway, component FlhB [Singulisphaera acidiphila DSM 18658]
MSEDRTQEPSKLRRQQARERGQVAHSAELTGSVGLLAAVVMLGFWGHEITAALVKLLREPLVGTPIISADPSEVVTRLRQLAVGVIWPILPVVGSFVLAAIGAHQAQVQGLWAPGLLAPDPTRLWTLGQGQGIVTRGGRGVWSLLKAVTIVAVAAWSIRLGWFDFQQFGAMDAPALARAVGGTLWLLATWLAAATLVLGLIDFALQYRRYEDLLRTTSEEHREDQRTAEGDPALRSKRRRLVKAWRGDSPELLAGASLILTGPSGLTLVLAGGPPPRSVSLRSAVQGASGLHLRLAAEAAKLPQVAAPDLARRLIGRRAPALPLPAEALAELASIWPADRSLNRPA